MKTGRFKNNLRLELFGICFAVTTAAVTQHITFELLQPTCELTYGRDVSIWYNVKSFLACSVLCAQDGPCLSVLYHPASRTCHANHDVTQLMSLPVSCGWMYAGLKLYGKPCSGSYFSERYRCVNDLYDCAIGFAFNPSTEECVLGCLQYGVTFQTVPQYRIQGDNDFTYYGITSLNDCENTCIAHTSFVCVSFELFVPVSQCIVHRISGIYKTMDAAPGQDSYVAHRNCA